MNLLDVMLLIPIAYGAWVGFNKGLIISVATMLALILGVWGGIVFSDYVSEGLLQQFDSESKYLPVAAFAITFIAIAVGVYFIGKLIEKSVNMVAMKPINKISGLVFGGVKWLFALSVALVIIEGFDQESTFISSDSKSNSSLYSPVKQVSITSLPALKDSKVVIEQIDQGLEIIQSDSLLTQN